MCFLMEVVQHQKLVSFLIFTSLLVTLYQKIDVVKQGLVDLNGKCEHNIDSYANSLITLKNTVDIMRKQLRETESKLKKAAEEFALYKADKTGLVDYAYRGRVTATGGTETYESEGLSLIGVPICGQTYLEGRIVEAAVMPGDCWPFKGQQGSAVIELTDEVTVSRVTVEHAPKELLPNGTASAPRDFSLLGLAGDEQGSGNGNGNGNGNTHFFGRFTYNASAAEVQTFDVQIPSDKSFAKVEVQFHSNHGHPEFTCVYRVRVHGEPRRGNA